MPIEVDKDSFQAEILGADKPVIVDFWGPRCGPCLALTPGVEALEDLYRDRIKITKVDASKNRRLCLQLKVLGLPTFLFFKKGEEQERLTGNALTINEIEDSLKKIIAQP